MDPKDRPNRLNSCEAVIAAAFDEVDSLHAGGGQVSDSPNWTGNVSASSSPLPIEVEGYTIIREIHQGGQGVVYQALHDSSGRDVAIKVLRDAGQGSARERLRFEQEVQILRELDHPGLVTIHDLGMVDGRQYLVMPYIEGRPLDRYLQECEPTTLETLELFACICDALNAAHLNGVIHRDIKPGNILIDDDGKPRIVDFGLAKVAPQAGSSGFAGAIGAGTLTQPGQFVGSLLWASPEQADGRTRTIDVRSDVYSLGVVLYFALTARLPFDTAGSMRDVLNRIVSEEPVSPRARRRELNRDIETIILKCLSKDPSDRYLSAGDLARDVRRYLANEPIDARRHSPGYVLRKTLRRYRVPAGIAATFLIMLVCSTVISTVFWQHSKQRAAELEQVADFQSSLLGRLNVPEMGRGLRRDIIDRRRAALELAGLDEDDIQSGLLDLERSLDGVDFTSVARTSLGDNVFEDALQGIEEQFAEQPLVQAQLLQSVADVLQRLNMPDRAAEPQERALEIYRRELGDTATDTLRSLLAAGMLLLDQSRMDESEAYLRRAEETARRELGVEHEITLNALNKLGILLESRGEDAESLECWREVVDVGRDILGEENGLVRAAIGNVGIALAKLGREAEAEASYREVLEIRRRLFGDNHPSNLGTVQFLGTCLHRQGKLEEAERYLREALESWRRTKGDEHWRTHWAMHYLAELLRDRDMLDEAERLGAEAVQKGRQTWVDERPQGAARFLLSHARTLIALERFEQTEAELLEAQAMFEDADVPINVPTMFKKYTRKLTEAFADLYDAWHAAEPDMGYDAKAAEWRARLQQMDGDGELAPSVVNEEFEDEVSTGSEE